MGKADLHLSGAHRIAQHAKHRHLCHGVAVDLELTNRLVFAIYHNEPLKIRLTTLIGAFCFHLAVMVDAHNKDGGQVCAPAVGHAVHFHGLSGLLRQLRPGFRLLAALFQPASAHKKQYSCQHQHSQRSSGTTMLFLSVQAGKLPSFLRNIVFCGKVFPLPQKDIPWSIISSQVCNCQCIFVIFRQEISHFQPLGSHR